jgi:hypothetical protein
MDRYLLTLGELKMYTDKKFLEIISEDDVRHYVLLHEIKGAKIEGKTIKLFDGPTIEKVTNIDDIRTTLNSTFTVVGGT